MSDRTAEVPTGGWFTSSYSASNAQCVEVRFVGRGTDIRDSKHRTGPTLTFANGDWSSFVAGLTSGALDA